MNHLPRFFNRSDKSKAMDSKLKQRKPKLERRNALKGFDYEPTTSSSSSASGESPALRTRSLDLSPIGDRTSFRVEGIDGEFDLICQRLGLSGPEDFAIPAAAWEAMKVRSSSDILPRSRLQQQLDSPAVELRRPTQVADRVADQLADTFAGNVRVGNVAEEQIDFIQLNDCSTTGGGDGDGDKDICELSVRLKDSVRNEPAESVGCGIPVELRSGRGRGCGGGINGVRPPVLAPPPSIMLPVVDNAGSTWDIFRSFAPDNDRDPAFVIRGGFSSDDEEEEADGESVKRENVTENPVLSESCSFTTTSNDDDSSSTTTEPISSISPNALFIQSITDFEKGDLLGRGSFGSVYEGISNEGVFFAVKEVSLLDQGEQGRQSILQLKQEIDLLSKFKHENILRYLGTLKDESKFYIFLELVTKGSLLSLYQKYHLQDSQVSAYTRQILHGLRYLHDQNVVHRDIKCANILVDASGSVKLADFGLAKATKLNDVKSCKGTAFWMAPEVVNRRNQGYGLAADIWSLGCTVLEMLTRQLPYSPLECMQALFRIGRGIPPPVPDTLSGDARDFILQCLQANPNDRPTAAQLLDHSFVKRPIPSSSGSASPLNPGRRV